MASNLTTVLVTAAMLMSGTAASWYLEALTNSLLFFEAQRSGRLPAAQRVQWRGDSGLRDGQSAGINLTGGYYDAGDNVKFGFPMAFAVTALSWAAVDFRTTLSSKGQLGHVLEAVRWGMDYFIKAHPEPNVLYAEVGDGDSDHACWQRPEDMDTPRTVYRIDEGHPGSDLAAETAAAMAAASIAFATTDPTYANTLINHARQLFDFACSHPSQYKDSIPVVRNYYGGSGYQDEILWGAAWLHRATGDKAYLDMLAKPQGGPVGQQPEFSWDDKYAGVQTLVAKMVLEGKLPNTGIWATYKNSIEQFVCSCVQKGNNNVKMTPGGLLWWYESSSLQQVGGAMLIASAYSDYLAAAHSALQCPGGTMQPSDLIIFTRKQVDYVLGLNPLKMSFMVGFGNNFPQQVHHRGASIVSIKKDPSHVSCKEGYFKWFGSKQANPNVLVGAVVAGPNSNDQFHDLRSFHEQTEAALPQNAVFVGVLARLSALP